MLHSISWKRRTVVKNPLEELWSSTLNGLKEKEDELEKANEIEETAYSGLKDIGSLLELV